MADFYGMHENTRNFMALWRSYKPTIARIEGYCIGGGISVAQCCDLRLASDDARFGIPALASTTALAKLLYRELLKDGDVHPVMERWLTRLLDAATAPVVASDGLLAPERSDADEARINTALRDALVAYVPEEARPAWRRALIPQ